MPAQPIPEPDPNYNKLAKPTRTPPPRDSGSIELHRPAIKVPKKLLPEDLDKVEAMLKEDEALSHSLQRAGLTGDALQLAMDAQKMYDAMSFRAVQAMGGGATAQFFKIQADIDKLRAEAFATKDPVREKSLWQIIISLFNASTHLFDRASNAQYTSALIERLKKEKEQKNTTRGNKILNIACPANSKVAVAIQNGGETHEEKEKGLQVTETSTPPQDPKP